MRRTRGDNLNQLSRRSIVAELIGSFVYFTIAIIIETVTDLFSTIGDYAGVFAAIGNFSIEVNESGRTIKLTTEASISVASQAGT